MRLLLLLLLLLFGIKQVETEFSKFSGDFCLVTYVGTVLKLGLFRIFIEIPPSLGFSSFQVEFLKLASFEFVPFFSVGFCYVLV